MKIAPIAFPIRVEAGNILVAADCETLFEVNVDPSEGNAELDLLVQMANLGARVQNKSFKESVPVHVNDIAVLLSVLNSALDLITPEGEPSPAVQGIRSDLIESLKEWATMYSGAGCVEYVQLLETLLANRGIPYHDEAIHDNLQAKKRTHDLVQAEIQRNTIPIPTPKSIPRPKPRP